MSSKKIEPIFILGSARNGTTWFSNVIAGSKKITAVESKLHWGILENNIYKYKKYWGNLSSLDKYIKFVELYTSGDYFNLAKGNKQDLYIKKKNNFYKIYLDLMDKYAENNLSKYWLTKLDPEFYLDNKEFRKFKKLLESRYSKVHFFSIKRNLDDVVNSTIGMEYKQNSIRNSYLGKYIIMLLSVSRNVIHYKKIQKIINAEKGLLFKYDYFKSNPHEVLNLIFKKLEAPKPKEINRFKPNSSFINKKEISKKIYTYDRIIIKFLFFFFSYCPISAFLLLKIKIYFSSNFFPEFYRIKKVTYFREFFFKELKKNKEYGLIEIIKDIDK
ncbi:MAG: sulfotransferase [Halanaerobiales bacterium]|nr:sulfotransferase [Halanaerobiales bacterium]